MYKIRLLLISLFISFFKLHASAQNFTMIDTLPTGAYGTAEWGDFDNDGFKDLVYISQVLPTAACLIYHNQNNVFTEVSQQFPLLYNPAAKWADLDNDGFEDLVVCGLDSLLLEQTFIYKSNGNRTFTSMTHSLPGFSVGSIGLVDYNNDSLIDIAISGYASSGFPEAYIFKNTGSFNFNDISAPLIPMYAGELTWKDYDQDGLTDLVLNGDESPTMRIRFYRNMGADIFQQELFNFPGTSGTVDWIDYDLDGIEDLLITGVDSTFGNNITALYHNDGNRNFTLVPTNIPDFGEPSAVTIGDFNNDSIMDICLVGGNTVYNTYSVIAYGQGSTTFSFQPLTQAIIDNLFVDASDMDNDGDMDLVLSTYILRNDGTSTAIQTPNSSPNKILIYPNPASTVLNIFSERKVISYEVFDLQGRLVQQGYCQHLGNAISILQLPEGYYPLKLLTEDGVQAMSQITILR